MSNTNKKVTDKEIVARYKANRKKAAERQAAKREKQKEQGKKTITLLTYEAAHEDALDRGLVPVVAYIPADTAAQNRARNGYYFVQKQKWDELVQHKPDEKDLTFYMLGFKDSTIPAPQSAPAPSATPAPQPAPSATPAQTQAGSTPLDPNDL